MGKIWEYSEGTSPVIGVVFMLGLTVTMISIMAVSVFAFTLPEDSPDARILIREARGNIDKLSGNEIVLVHKGGEKLKSENVKIIITGDGKEAYKSGGSISGAQLSSIRITYNNLEFFNYVGSGKRKDHYFYNTSNDSYIEFADIVISGTWSSGQKVALYGSDGANSNNKNNVDRKWELKPGSTITVTVIDTLTDQVISSSSARVKENKDVVGY